MSKCAHLFGTLKYTRNGELYSLVFTTRNFTNWAKTIKVDTALGWCRNTQRVSQILHLFICANWTNLWCPPFTINLRSKSGGRLLPSTYVVRLPLMITLPSPPLTINLLCPPHTINLLFKNGVRISQSTYVVSLLWSLTVRGGHRKLITRGGHHFYFVSWWWELDTVSRSNLLKFTT